MFRLKSSHFFSSEYSFQYGPQWINKLLLLLVCCYPFIGARFLPLGDSGRYLSVLIAPLGLLYLIFIVQRPTTSYLLDALRKLSPWLPFIIAFITISFFHQKNFNTSQLSLRIIFVIILYACARALQINHRQLLLAAAIGAWLYLISSFFDVLSYYYPNLLRFEIPRHLTEKGIYRLGGGGGNPIHFANASMWLVGICTIGIFYKNTFSQAEKYFLSVSGIIVFLVCLATQSRGALLATIPLIALVSCQLDKNFRKLILIFVLLATGIGFLLATQTEYFHRIKRLFYDLYYYITEPNFIISSVSARLEMWSLSIRTWQDHFFLGVGISNIQDLLTLYPPSLPVHPAILIQPHFHNDWMQAISLGGLLLLLGLLISFVLIIYNSRKDPVLLWIVLSAICFGLSDLIMFQNTMLTFFISAWALFSASYDNQKYSTEHTHHC
jgi:O-antigen ligase